MDEKGKIARILDRMIGRRTNHDIMIMAERYIGDKLSPVEYDYLLARMETDGVDADGVFYEDYCLEGDAYQQLLADGKRHRKQCQKFRKNKQKQSKGKPKKKH